MQARVKACFWDCSLRAQLWNWIKHLVIVTMPRVDVIFLASSSYFLETDVLFTQKDTLTWARKILTEHPDLKILQYNK